MPMNNAEKKKRYFEKLKANGKFEDYKKKKASNEKKRRDRINAGLEELPKHVREKTKRLKRQYTRRKVSEYRQRKKNENGVLAEITYRVSADNVQPQEESYKTTSALAKAVTKVRRALPSTAQKKKEVVAKLLKSFDSNDIQDMITNKTAKPKRTKGLSSSDEDLVTAYYERDDISRMSPNVKDCRKFVNPATGVKEFKQLRFLMYKLSDVYAMFVKHIQNGNEAINPPVRFSKFCSLRPNHVKLVGNTPLEQCLCFYHSNIILCCAAMNRYMPEFPKYGQKMEELILCKNPQKDCWWGKCVHCPNTENTLAEIMNRSGKSETYSVTLTQWIKDKETNRYQKSVLPGTLKKLIDRFIEILPQFLKHSYIKRSQAASFEDDNEEVKHAEGKVASVQVDFSESFNCEGQDEIASAHWNQATV